MTATTPDTAAESVRFQCGDNVVERIGSGEDAPIEFAYIICIDNDVCQTSTGRFYCRLTGRGLPASDNYRAIHKQVVEP